MDDKNINPQNSTKTDGNTPTGVAPAIQTEYFDIPPHPQVAKAENQNHTDTNNTLNYKNKVANDINNDLNVDVINPESTILPTATTQVMGSASENVNVKEDAGDKVIKTSDPLKPKRKSKKILVPTILGILLLAGGLAAGVLLIGQNQDVRERADTAICTGCLDASGNCTVLELTSNTQCGAGGQLCVSCSATQTCVNGTCTTTQATPLPVIPIQCLLVEAYEVDEDSGIEKPSSWTKLTQNNLAKLTTGSYVYFTVTGKDTSGDTTKFTKARFKINNEEFVQVDAATNTKPAATSDPTNEIKLYYKYRIPTNTKQFEVNASIYHSDQGWIDIIE